jgi:hypothetical protein
MKRMSAAIAAIGCAFAISVSAQDTKVQTTIKTEGGIKTVTYSGCVGAGTQTRTYILDKVVPVTTKTETSSPGVSTTTVETRYVLVPDEKVEVQQHLGHKVEVTGMLIPAGDSKIKTETKVDNENAKDTKTTTTVKADNSLPQFRATSIKSTGEVCG